MSSQASFLGLVIARAGSKGVPNKNLVEIGGRTLLERAIITAKASRFLTRVICSTEDEALAAVARTAGAEVPFRRPNALADDYTGSWTVARHAITALDALDQERADYLVLLQPSTPFREARHIDAVIERMLTLGARSALSIRPADYPIQWMYWLGENGKITRVFTDGAKIKRRQDAKTAFRPDGLVYVVPIDVLMAPTFEFPDTGTVGVQLDAAARFNIDTMQDLEFARHCYAAGILA